MKINYMKANENIQFAILKAVTPDKSFQVAELNDADGNMDIEFKANGIELNFQNVIDAMMASYERLVLEEATKLATKKFNPGRLPDVDSDIYEIENELQTIRENVEALLNKTQELMREKIVDQLKN